MFKVASRTSTGKELTSWLSECAVIFLCRLFFFFFFFLFHSRIMSWEGCGIRLYRFLIIALSSIMKQISQRASIAHLRANKYMYSHWKKYAVFIVYSFWASISSENLNMAEFKLYQNYPELQSGLTDIQVQMCGQMEG